MEQPLNAAPGGLRAQAASSAARDTALLRRIRTGESALFCELVRPYLSNVYLLSLSVLHSPADAEDVSQEALLKAFKHLDEVHREDSFKSWLLQIAFNEARMRLRKQKNHPFEPLETEEKSGDKEENFSPRDFGTWHENPLESLERKEMQRVVLRALGSLRRAYREVLVLRDLQQLGVPETARILGTSPAVVSTRLHRARMEMRERLTPVFRKPGYGWMPLWMMVDMAKRMAHPPMLSCRTVMSELSNYLEGRAEPRLRAELEKHLQYCRRCSVVLDTLKKMIYIVGDEKVWQLPMEKHPAQLDLLRERLGLAREPGKAAAG